ncbi:PAS domain-containing sensor histidine kinase [Hymenobacter terricola]|uniref:PAS domain-containing sensor histidine kinase n=1 Tax=Hymenobacter terricola TaxID=2819236 RepID=UPI001B303F4E|nr:PAS domain-containing protein [Hymenobacter terricola]
MPTVPVPPPAAPAPGATPPSPPEALYQLFEHTPAAICMLRGPEHRYEYHNATYQQLFPGRALHGRPVAEALPETVAGGFVALLDNVYRTGETYFGYEAPFLLEQPGGQAPQQLYFTFTYQAYREHGAIVGISTFAYDVTAQVQARQQRDAQQRQQQELFEQAPVAMAVFRGPRYVIEEANPAVCRLWGRTLAQALGTPLFELLPEAAGQGFEELLAGVLATGVPYVAHELPALIDRLGRRDTVYWDFVYHPLREADGRVTGITVVATEVSEQVRARQQVQALNQQLEVANVTLQATNAELRAHNAELRRTQRQLQRLNQTLDARVAERTQASEASTRQLRLITDALPVLIGHLDAEQRYRFANRAYEAWFNQPADALLGRTVAEVVGAAAYAGVQHYIKRALAGERLDFEARMPYREDFVKYIRTSFVPDIQAGAVVGYYSLVSDITEEVLSREQVQGLNEQLATSNEELHAANDELGATNQYLTRTNVDLDTFVYTASHDLKDPITNLDGLLHALREELPPENRVGQVAYILNLMQGSIDRFQRTISQLSAIGQLQQERGQPAPPVFLANVISDVRLDLASLIQAVDAQLVVEVRGFPSFPFSEKNLRSVVYNLLSNALKYRHPDRVPQVHLLCRLEAPHWVLEVRDNGLGVDLTPDRPLFGLFQRYHTHVEGSGVGLYMVKKMVENAGGRVAVQSQPGVGSTFTVYFRY